MSQIKNTFKVFDDLPAGSDDELYQWVTKSCHPRSVTNYEDAHVTIIRRWLRALTGIDWVRGYEHGDRGEGQYGVVHFLRSEDTDYPDTMTNMPDDSGDFCQKSSVVQKFVYQLDVIRESGLSNNRQDTFNIDNPIYSAPDPFIHMRARMNLPIFREALNEYCMFVEDGSLGTIQNIPQEIQSRFEHRATANLSVIATVTGSIREVGQLAYNFKQVNFCKEQIQGVVQDD